MARPRNCPRCRKPPVVEENDLLGGWLVICSQCEWVNEGGDKAQAIDQWNEANFGKENEVRKGNEKKISMGAIDPRRI
jgi:ribosomal protein L37AE/L43A